MDKTLAIIQARTGSSRLPGKVLYPLDGRTVLDRVVQRTSAATHVNKTVVATSTKSQDDILARRAPQYGAEIIRGREQNVLDRFYKTVEQYDPDRVVRVTADCPLLLPEFVDYAIASVASDGIDYTTTGLKRTFARGVTAEAFTATSFQRVYENSNKPHHREHVTPYYREHPELFSIKNIRSEEIFDEDRYHDRTDIRLTLDEADDFVLLTRLYEEISYDDILPVRRAIDYIDKHGLADINSDVEQHTGV